MFWPNFPLKQHSVRMDEGIGLSKDSVEYDELTATLEEILLRPGGDEKEKEKGKMDEAARREAEKAKEAQMVTEELDRIAADAMYV